MRLGIDLGGTKIEIIALDDEGHELLRRRVPTLQGNYYERLWASASATGALVSSVQPGNGGSVKCKAQS